MQPNKSKETVEWQAPEYTEHHHSFGWFALLIFLTITVSGLVYLITRDIFGVVIMVLLGFIVGIAASHKPKNINYELSPASLSVNDKIYYLAQFKSFSVVDEAHLVSATLMPLKRFMLPLAIYMKPEDADKVLDTLSTRLPHDDRAPDVVDRLAQRLRF